MKFQLELPIVQNPKKIQLHEKILLLGSCFTEHISERLSMNGFDTMANPHGILFNPLSIVNSLEQYLNHRTYHKEDLFYLNELWNSWEHHSRFSHTDPDTALLQINSACHNASKYLKESDWLILTLGSAFQYYLVEKQFPVANNHRAPAAFFEKKLLKSDFIIRQLAQCIHSIKKINPKLKILFTISPVRHSREGLIENNRSKAQLIEAVHCLCEQLESAYYFPAYELVIDVLRDYRFYDIDLVHPNFAATQYVWERFSESYFDDTTQKILPELYALNQAQNHKAKFPNTQAHKDFCKRNAEKCKALMLQYPYLKLQDKLAYFENS